MRFEHVVMAQYQLSYRAWTLSTARSEGFPPSFFRTSCRISSRSIPAFIIPEISPRPNTSRRANDIASMMEFGDQAGGRPQEEGMTSRANLAHAHAGMHDVANTNRHILTSDVKDPLFPRSFNVEASGTTAGDLCAKTKVRSTLVFWGTGGSWYRTSCHSVCKQT